MNRLLVHLGGGCSCYDLKSCDRPRVNNNNSYADLAMAPGSHSLLSAPLDFFQAWSDCILRDVTCTCQGSLASPVQAACSSKKNTSNQPAILSLFPTSAADGWTPKHSTPSVASERPWKEVSASSNRAADSSNGVPEGTHPNSCEDHISPATSSQDADLDDVSLLLHFTDQVYLDFESRTVDRHHLLTAARQLTIAFAGASHT